MVFEGVVNSKREGFRDGVGVEAAEENEVDGVFEAMDAEGVADRLAENEVEGVFEARDAEGVADRLAIPDCGFEDLLLSLGKTFWSFGGDTRA